MTAILAFLGLNYEAIILVFLGIYEVVVSVVPTVQNYSVLSFIVRVLRLVVPNRAKGGNQFKEVPLPENSKVTTEGENWTLEAPTSDIEVNNNGIIKRLIIRQKQRNK